MNWKVHDEFKTSKQKFQVQKLSKLIDCCIWFQFTMVKLYQTKLVVIKKEMLQLHERATKLKVSKCLQPSLICKAWWL
jgi:hypothetical protein